MKYFPFLLLFSLLISSCQEQQEEINAVRNIDNGFSFSYDVKIVQEFISNNQYYYELNFRTELNLIEKTDNRSTIECRFSRINLAATSMGESAGYNTSESIQDTTDLQMEVMRGLMWIESKPFEITLDSGNWQSFTLDVMMLPDSLQNLSQLQSTIEYLFIGMMAIFPDLPNRKVTQDEKWQTTFFPLGELNRKKGLTSSYSVKNSRAGNVVLKLSGRDADEGNNIQVGLLLEMNGELVLDKKTFMLENATYVAREEISILNTITGIISTITIQKSK